MSDKLKKGWTRVAFGDVVQLCRERSADPSEDGFDRYVGLEHLDPGDLKIRRWGNTADDTTFTNVFRAGQVLFGKRRAYQRKLAVADFDGVCSGDIYVLESANPKTLLPELLPFICQTDSFFEHAVGTSAGSLSPRTNWESLASYEFVLPPLAEQRRISEVLAGCESVRDVFITGKLTAQTLLESEREAVFTDPKCKRITLGCISSVRYGLGQPPAEDPNGIMMIRATNIDSGRILPRGMLRIAAGAVPDSRNAYLKSGDILLVRSGAYTGDSALITDKWAGSVAGYDLVLTPDTTKVLPQYLANFLLARRTVVCVLRALSARTAQPHLNVDDVCGIAVPCPDLRLQQLASDRMIQEQSCIDALEMRITQVNNFKSAVLRQTLNQEVS